MPWTPSDGPKRHTHKANTPKKKRQWSDVANKVLATTGDEGRAVREANAVVARGRGGQRKHSYTETNAYDWRRQGGGRKPSKA